VDVERCRLPINHSVLLQVQSKLCLLKMAPIILYHSPISPFSRSVLLLTRYLELDVEVKVLDLMSKEQFSPEFLKINPQHCVPTIDDNGFYLWESRAILCYLLETRAPHLLPTSPKEKAILNQRLQFELGGLTNKFTALFVRKNFHKSFYVASCG
jgi:glutathione S-transferase